MKQKNSKFSLYEAAVQDPTSDLRLFQRIYRRQFARMPLHIREDFCASFLTCVTWVKGGKKRTATGVDLSPNVLQYGFQHHVPKLSITQRKRLQIVLDDVLKVKTRKCHMILATNFSICFLKQRTRLIQYFKNVRRGLLRQGIFFLDIFGGTNTEFNDFQARTFPLPSGKGTFRYSWEQEQFNPITRETTYAIHFKLRGQKIMRRAFTYDWRLWSLPELKDALLEAGFKQVDFYWEGDDNRGGGNGVFRKVRSAENCQSWICYIAAL